MFERSSAHNESHDQNQTNKCITRNLFTFPLDRSVYSQLIQLCSSSTTSRIEFHFYFTIFIFVWHCSCRLLLDAFNIVGVGVVLVWEKKTKKQRNGLRLDDSFHIEYMWISTSLFSAIQTIIIKCKSNSKSITIKAYGISVAAYIGNENQIKTPTSMHRIKIKKKSKKCKTKWSDRYAILVSSLLLLLLFFFLNSNANP